MKNILVTGGAGFIGSNLVEELVKRGYNVSVLDNLTIVKTYNLNKVLNKIIFENGDTRNRELVDSLIKGKDYVVNLAAVSSSQMFEPSPIEGYEVNVNGFINILDASVKYNIKNVVYASTSSLYSRIKPPHKEDAIIQPRTFYEATKLEDENLARIYYELHSLKSVGLRFFAVYGPHEIHKGRYCNMVSQWIWGMMKDERIAKAGRWDKETKDYIWKQPEIWGNGTQTRDFTYVTDIVEGIIKSLESNYSGVLNLGYGKAYTLNDLVRIINEKLGTNIKPKYIPNPLKNYVMYTLADTNLAKEKIEFKAKISLEEGVERLIKFYRETLS